MDIGDYQKKVEASNAASQSFGWEFEYAAAYYFFLRELSTAISVGCEKQDDICLEWNDGRLLYGQAKSATNCDSLLESHAGDIKKALKTLFNANKMRPAAELHIVFNYRRPFGKDCLDLNSVQSPSSYPFEKFHSSVRLELQEYARSNEMADFEWGKLFLTFVPFDPTEQPENVIKELLKEKLRKVGGDADSSASDIMVKSLHLIRRNSSNPKGSVSKGLFLGTIVGTLLKHRYSVKDLADRSGLEADLRDDIYDAALTELFDSMSKDFAMYSAVYKRHLDYATDYSQRANLTVTLQGFIKTLKDEDIPPGIKDYATEKLLDPLRLYQLFCTYVISKRDYITNINREFV